MDFTMMVSTYISLYFAFKHSPLPLFYPHAQILLDGGLPVSLWVYVFCSKAYSTR